MTRKADDQIHPVRMDQFSPIAEEVSPPPQSTVVSPAFGGSQTASTESNQTVKGSVMHKTPGDDQIQTPSYPFPPMNLESGTPAGTPALHKPFTALSPTIAPSPMKLAKGQTAREFQISSHLDPSTMQAFLAQNVPGIQNNGPNLLEVLLRIQLEPSLPAFWTHVSQILKSQYGAERVTLAIPSDSTDVENVPWAQLATYNTSEDDPFSRMTIQPESARSSLNEIASQDGTIGESKSDRQSPTASTRHPQSSSSPVMPSRPKIESRHSYAGYPPKSPPKTADILDNLSGPQKRPTAVRTSSHLSLRGGRPIDDSSLRNVELSAESLQRHNASHFRRGPLSDDTYASSKPSPARVLDVVQPLELEADPLLTSAGVVRVLDRGKMVILTREYVDETQPPEQKDDREKKKNAGAVRQWPQSRTHSSSSQSTASGPHIVNLKPLKRQKRAESQVSETSKEYHVSYQREPTRHVVYEDCEQIPASPWSQSPAPSPAVQGDPDYNPFFINVCVDEEAFAENPPIHNYDLKQPIEAIGIDRATSIIHVPLIHPTLSQPRRPQRLQNERKNRNLGSGSDKPLFAFNSNLAQSSLASSSENEKRTPIAILSILAPTVPYLPGLAESLNNLAPYLATLLYNARHYSNLEKEVAALSRRRSFLGAKTSHHLPGDLSSSTAGLTFIGLRDRPFSPTSTNSVKSTSEYSYASLHSPHGSMGGGSVAGTPGLTIQDHMHRGNTKFLDSPKLELPPNFTENEGYFSPKIIHSARDENRVKGSLNDHTKDHARTDRNPKKLHPRGSDVKLIHPSQAATTVAAPSTGNTSVEPRSPMSLDYVFEKPSLEVLESMIELGATQQFIAEPERGKIVWANSKFLSYRNELAGEIHRRPWANIHKDEKPGFRAAWEKVRTDKDQLSYQVRLRRFDDEYRWFHMRILPVKDNDGLIQYWHGQAMDIHDQHTAEVNLVKENAKVASEAKYRALANSNPHIIFAASIPNGITFANTQWLSYSGQTSKESYGFGFLDHVHSEDLIKCRFPEIDTLSEAKNPLVRGDSTSTTTHTSESTDKTDNTVRPQIQVPDSPVSGTQAPSDLLRDLVQAGVIRCFKDGQGNLSITTEMRLKSGSGEYRWHLVQGSLIESVNFGTGDAEWIIACADITEQKQSEAKLKKVNDALEKEMSRKMEYLSSMSHEIRTPLNGILGNLQFLTNSGLDEHQADWTYGALKAAQGMHTLINDILDVSKAEAKMLKLSVSWFTPRSIIEEVIETLNSKSTEKGIELCYELALDAPSPIKGDAGRIKQILLNLVGNAIKFTNVGEVWIKCDVLDRGPGDTPNGQLASNEVLMQFSVQDTGNGFTEEDKKLLFKPYSQIDNNDNRNVGGTGLGLILCRTMVELHGGKIDAASVPGQGSIFTFYARFVIREPASESSGSQLIATPGSVTQSPAPLGYSHLLHKGITESPGNINPTGLVNRVLGSERDSPAILSSGSSDPSMGSMSSQRSVRSSVSTVDNAIDVATMRLKLPTQLGMGVRGSSDDNSSTPKPVSNASQVGNSDIVTSVSAVLEADIFRPPMLSILVVCPQFNTRRTTQEHIQRVLPKSTPSQVTTDGDVGASLRMLSGDTPVTFTHVVLQLGSPADVLTFVQKILTSSLHAHTCIVVVTDQAQKTAIISGAPEFNYDQLSADGRLRFLLKPAKPHKFAKIFDPKQENDQSNEDFTGTELKAKARANKEAYAMFGKVLGGKGTRVLAVEDNQLNMDVCCNFLTRNCGMIVTRAKHGQECLDLVFAEKPLHYSVIVMDIEMPVMDGYTACRKIREWEENNNHSHVPMISLSANVMRKGWHESAEAGFTHYSMKPVDWVDLGHIIVEILDPAKSHIFLRDRPLPPQLLEEEAEEREEAARKAKAAAAAGEKSKK